MAKGKNGLKKHSAELKKMVKSPPKKKAKVVTGKPKRVKKSGG